ncbi:hypothetical protein BDZ91DRAFT_712982, partial [Kalaharituber pfeilii]
MVAAASARTAIAPQGPPVPALELPSLLGASPRVSSAVSSATVLPRRNSTPHIGAVHDVPAFERPATGKHNGVERRTSAPPLLSANLAFSFWKTHTGPSTASVSTCNAPNSLSTTTFKRPGFRESASSSSSSSAPSFSSTTNLYSTPLPPSRTHSTSAPPNTNHSGPKGSRVPASTPLNYPVPHPPHLPHSTTNATASTNCTPLATTTVTPSLSTYDKLLFDYHTLAPSMHTYRQLCIFRRFGKLYLASLLDYQDQLSSLESKLSAIDQEEVELDRPQDEYVAGELEERKERLRYQRMSVLSRARELLKAYYEALLVQDQVFVTLEPPRGRDVNLLGELLAGANASEKKEGDGLMEVVVDNGEKKSGEATQTHGKVGDDRSRGYIPNLPRDDLVALGLGDRDSLEKLMGQLLPRLLPSLRARLSPSIQDLHNIAYHHNRTNPHSHPHHHSDVSDDNDDASNHPHVPPPSQFHTPLTRRLTRLLIALATTLVLLIPMCILTFVEDPVARLVGICIFTVPVAIGLALSTRGKGENVVMMVAAYCAVLVVFVGQEGGKS